MLNGFGIYGTAVQVVMVLWFFYLGFLVKKVIKEQQETNRLLAKLANAGAVKETAKAA
jgi:hypothetical protein